MNLLKNINLNIIIKLAPEVIKEALYLLQQVQLERLLSRSGIKELSHDDFEITNFCGLEDEAW